MASRRVTKADSSRLAARLERAGVGATPARLAVLEELAREPDDATAQTIHRRLADAGRGVGLATVYRALGSFAEAGVVDSLPHHAGESCYRLCAEGHHHHLVCTDCHRVVELSDCHVTDWLAGAAAAEGFVATGHRLEATGLCASCRAA
ncbi:MAG: Fur family transcriptional regulator, ferric uptake regulator [Solirubrobacteraceae bacterium]|jgi:Fur family ferric uptake transcriptional regulator|nr:Fur family transcriptional regulator, ferric uptake regulator [Solirubrobacteraceae bacterium]